MYGGIIVDGNLLQKGIYMTMLPTLYNEDETIEGLVENAEYIMPLAPTVFNEAYIENLKQCKLVDVVIKQPPVSGMLKCCSCGYEYENLIISKDGIMRCNDCAL